MAQRDKASGPSVEDIVNAAVAGLSHTQIAKHFHTTTAAVRSALDQHAVATLTPAARASLLALQIERLKQLQSHFMRYAIENNDPAAGTLVAKLGQRLAALAGLDQPQQVRMDVINHLQEPDTRSNTQKMLEAVRWLRAEHARERERTGPDPDQPDDCKSPVAD